MNTGMTSRPGWRDARRGSVRQVALHLGAMHLSGVILLCSFLIPPAWALDAYGAAPVSDPSADVPPFAILASMLFACVAFHVLVQIPSGLLGTWLGRNHSGLIGYASALVVAGVLTALVLRVALHSEDVSLWADLMARGSVGLAGYAWVSRRRVRAA
ncbi:hypothetical protein [Streptomyces olivochromogenes]|uniref:Uncharacterized protein n=1 Tax=Streptomyces olivochromogenes TaxID=1963 RepID=A0A250V754_STROL|nr:hypothetical protein [Streptomyces olivochromogenes]GAX49856.1 hypothetical protein SO3561_01345 [Streptomyces olivochromogenes]